MKLLTKIKKQLLLFTYIDRLNRICNRCGGHQRKYGYAMFFKGWEEQKPKSNNPKCKCHRYTIQK